MPEGGEIERFPSAELSSSSHIQPERPQADLAEPELPATMKVEFLAIGLVYPG